MEKINSTAVQVVLIDNINLSQIKWQKLYLFFALININILVGLETSLTGQFLLEVLGLGVVPRYPRTSAVFPDRIFLLLLNLLQNRLRCSKSRFSLFLLSTTRIKLCAFGFSMFTHVNIKYHWALHAIVGKFIAKPSFWFTQSLSATVAACRSRCPILGIVQTWWVQTPSSLANPKMI